MNNRWEGFTKAEIDLIHRGLKLLFWAAGGSPSHAEPVTTQDKELLLRLSKETNYELGILRK